MPGITVSSDEFVALVLGNHDGREPRFGALLPLERVWIPTRI